MPSRFRFGAGYIDPLTQRRIQLQEQALQERARIDFGRQELAVMSLAVRAAQEETNLKNQIAQQREVALATKEVSVLDTTDPKWREKYAEVMSKYPYAANDKFLNENFSQIGHINQAAVDASYRDMEEKQRTLDARDRITQQEQAHEQEQQSGLKVHNAEDTQKFMETAAQRGVDLSPFIKTDDSGNTTHDWSGIANAFSSAKANVPTPGIIEDYVKAHGDLANYQNAYDAAVKAHGTASVKAGTAEPFDDSTFQDINKLKEARDKVNTLQQAYPSLSKLGQKPQPAPVQQQTTNPPAQPPPSPTPSPSATPQQSQKPPSIPQGAIDYLKQNPGMRDQFDQKFGQGSAAAYLGQ